MDNFEDTGKERDAESGLDYFNARDLHSAQGRFTAVIETRLRFSREIWELRMLLGASAGTQKRRRKPRSKDSSCQKERRVVSDDWSQYHRPRCDQGGALSPWFGGTAFPKPTEEALREDSGGPRTRL